MNGYCTAVSILFLSLLITCSTGERIAGSKGGSETTNGITACIYHIDGTPAAGSIVRMRHSNYLSSTNPSLPMLADDDIDIITDHTGRFAVWDVEPGTYCIEVTDMTNSSDRGDALLLNCMVDDTGMVDLGTDSLRPHAAVTGRVTIKDNDRRQWYAQIRGLERLTIVDSSGTFTFHDLPGGTYDVCLTDAATIGATHEFLNVRTLSGDTVSVTVDATCAYSGYIQISTTASGLPLSGTLTAFPLCIRFDSLTFDFTQADREGSDIQFTDTNGTVLSHDIETWDPEAQMAVVWVRIDTLLGNSSARIVMKWGDPGAKKRSDDGLVFDRAEGFAGVWHFNETLGDTFEIIKDRTANSYHGTTHGTMNGDNSIHGIIGNGLMFDGNDDYITAGQLNLTGSYSLSCWIHADDLATARRFIWKEYSYTLWYDANGQGTRVEHFTDSLIWRGIYQDYSDLHPLKAQTWYYLVGTFDGDKVRLFVDGIPVDSTHSIGEFPHESREPLSLGGRKNEYVKGIMDEVRIENRARSPEWIRMCYLNQRTTDGITIEFRRK